MTWLGKILAVCAMVLALVWMWFTATVYVTRTNWKARSDQYQKAYEEAKAAREGEYRVYLAKEDALAKQVAAAEGKAAGLDRRLAELTKANADYTGQITALNATIKDTDVSKAVSLQAGLQAAQSELDAVRKRSGELEVERVRLTVLKEEAEKAKLAAEIAMRQSQAQLLLAQSLTEDLRAQLADARSPGGATARLLGGPQPSPVPQGFRGTVEAVGADGGGLVLSVGADAGLSVGAEVDVYRTGTGAKYLGKAVVTRVEPKMSAATFRPASGRPVSQLRPDERPRKDDEVGKVGAR